MTFKKFFILFLLFSVVCSINVIAAADLEISDNNLNTPLEDNLFEISEDSIESSEYLTNSNLYGEDISLNSKSEVISSNSENYSVWVGQNVTKDGNGSSENPYATFELACNGVNSNYENVVINVDEGTYDLTSLLTFNVNNLYIIGTSGNVVIKNVPSGSFALSSSSGNFSMSNIIIDGDYPLQMSTVQTEMNYIFKGLDANLVTFNNCTFKECFGFLYFDVDNYNPEEVCFETYVFNNCKFLYESMFTGVSPMTGMIFRNVFFKNCLFNYKTILAEFSEEGSGIIFNHINSFENCWFGQNSLLAAFYSGASYNGEYLGYDINRYAIFSISENYLGNNNYEVLGKLTWSDGTTDGFENLTSMVVNLSSDTGDFNQKTAILDNGTFKVIYTSSESNHKITATLDNEIQTVEFESINMVLDAPSITYGDNQNITVTLPDQYNGIITVIVNNKTYTQQVEYTNVVTINITDVLPVGVHDVNVNFVDKIDNETCAIYGFNTTTITVSKVSEYEFNVNITPYKVYVGDNATITLSLPNYANGTVTVKIGDNEAKTFNVNETITINGFEAGNNVVNITYKGNDIYDAKSIVRNISALNKPAITIPEINAGKATTTNITLPENATGNITLTVDEKDYIFNVTNGSATITIPELSAGKHNVTISYSGDGNYAGFSQTSVVEVKEPAKPTPKPDDKKPATTKKTPTKITAKKKTFKAKTKVKKYTITLKAGKKAVKKVQVILKIGKKTYKAKTNAKGKATFKIKKLTKKGKYTAKITFKGNKLYKATTKKVKITVKK
ncbi:Ig-like domain-containing protein [Methanobrevibacter thaueri]|uniref:Bacterial Ig-like domain-containing protein n=1 Tax=Methanobrevibacter thaueri TaxID=190975 RepID=A0A315XQU0_9EURY|nr:Ig-like domain-containing protein [Methanobrevibacter thaueri]PWB88383.1 hypothetical protein MBBTH_00160 [Methanobrevibacter thaueri]